MARTTGCASRLRRGNSFVPYALVAVAAVGGFLFGSVQLVRQRTDSVTANPAVNELRELGPFLRNELQTIACQFRVENGGSETVTFVDKITSCGCARADIGSTVLEPGQHTVLNLAATADGFRKVRRGITCDLITDTGAVWRYSFRAKVYPNVAFSVDRLFMGYLDGGAAVERSVGLECYTRPGQEPFKPVEIRSPSTKLHVSCAGPASTVVVRDGVVRHTWAFKLTVDGEPSGVGSSLTFRLPCSNGTEVVAAVLPISWRVRQVYRVEPPRAFFGHVGLNDPGRRSMSIVLSRVDRKPFALIGVHSSDGAVQCRAALHSPATKHELTVVLDPAMFTRALWGEVQVQTDQRPQSVARIPFSAFSASDGGT